MGFRAFDMPRFPRGYVQSERREIVGKGECVRNRGATARNPHSLWAIVELGFTVFSAR